VILNEVKDLRVERARARLAQKFPGVRCQIPAVDKTLAAATVAADALEFVLAYFAAESIAVDSQRFRAAGLIALKAFQHTAYELFLEFTDCFLEQDSSLHHHSDQRFQLIFHDCTLRSGASEWALPWA
jgi:hypothetical protein